MIAAYYIVKAYDYYNNKIVEVKAYSFSEAYYNIDRVRDTLGDKVVKFEIVIPDEFRRWVQ